MARGFGKTKFWLAVGARDNGAGAAVLCGMQRIVGILGYLDGIRRDGIAVDGIGIETACFTREIDCHD